MRQTLEAHVCDLTRAVAPKKVAVSVQVYLAVKHDEHHSLTMIERAVGEWLVREVESLLAEGTGSPCRVTVTRSAFVKVFAN